MTSANSGNFQAGTLPGTFSNIQIINAGTGTNTLTGGNTANTWNLTGANAGQIVGSITYTNMQNIVGGNNGNTFKFINNAASISGIINGGSNVNNNVFDFSAHSFVNVKLTNSIYNGIVSNASGGATFAQYTNIGTLIGNTANASQTAGNQLILPNTLNVINKLVINSAKSGYISDPLSFQNFSTIQSVSGRDTVQFNVPVVVNASGHYVIIGSAIIYLPGFNLASNSNNNNTIPVAPIITQGNTLTPSKSSPSSSNDMYVSQVMNQSINLMTQNYDASLINNNNVTVTQFCSQKIDMKKMNEGTAVNPKMNNTYNYKDDYCIE